MRNVVVGAFAVAVLASCGGQDAGDRAAQAPAEDFVDAPLASTPGDAAEGREVFASRERGHCVACHQAAGLDAEFQGDVGPALSDVGARLTPGQIRFRIIDAARLNPETIMPSYYRSVGLRQVQSDYRGKTILTAQEVEHLVAYLSSLKGGP